MRGTAAPLVIILCHAAFAQNDPAANRVEETDPSVTYTGTWNPQNDARASGGSFTVSNVAGNTLSWQFTGDSFVLYRGINTDGGQATVTVDGNVVNQGLNFYFTEQRWQIPAVFDHLGTGTHTLVVTVSGQAVNGSTGQNVYIDALQAPAPYSPNAGQQGGIDRVNYYRQAVGLPPVTASMPAILAAQAHADYLATAGIVGHVETVGAAGYVGTEFGDRMGYFGYDAPDSEDAAGSGNPNAAVDAWIGGILHRLPILKYNLLDVGYGVSTLNGHAADVMDFGSKSGTAPTTRTIITFPGNGQTEVPVDYVNEAPASFPADTPPMGYALSLHISQPANATTARSTGTTIGTLTDANGQNVPFNFLDRTNYTVRDLKDNYYMVPKQPLKVSSTYTAHVTGTDTTGTAFDVTWSFTTIPAATITSTIPFSIGPTSLWLQWDTAGKTASTQLQYGPTAAYGTTIPGPQNNSTRTVVQLTNLTPSTTYHYQVTATDTAGTTRSTDDRTFTTASFADVPAATIMDTLPFGITATSAWLQWDTAGPMKSSQVQYGPTTAYGTTIAGPNDKSQRVDVNLTNLTPGTTYHYQVTVTDDAGVTKTTEDRTFTTLTQ